MRFGQKLVENERKMGKVHYFLARWRLEREEKAQPATTCLPWQKRFLPFGSHCVILVPHLNGGEALANEQIVLTRC